MAKKRIAVGMRVFHEVGNYRGVVVEKRGKLVVVELDRPLMPAMPVVAIPASEVVEER